jgi:hypothetical protein
MMGKSEIRKSKIEIFGDGGGSLLFVLSVSPDGGKNQWNSNPSNFEFRISDFTFTAGGRVARAPSASS